MLRAGGDLRSLSYSGSRPVGRKAPDLDDLWREHGGNVRRAMSGSDGIRGQRFAPGLCSDAKGANDARQLAGRTPIHLSTRASAARRLASMTARSAMPVMIATEAVTQPVKESRFAQGTAWSRGFVAPSETVALRTLENRAR
jgi:hypothetical protein